MTTKICNTHPSLAKFANQLITKGARTTKSEINNKVVTEKSGTRTQFWDPVRLLGIVEDWAQQMNTSKWGKILNICIFKTRRVPSANFQKGSAMFMKWRKFPLFPHFL